MTKPDFRLFTEAISNDIINWDTIVSTMNNGGVTYADTSVFIKDIAEEVPEINGCKFISGAKIREHLKENSSPWNNNQSINSINNML